MKRFAFVWIIVACLMYGDVMAQQLFPVDPQTEKITFQATEASGVSKLDMYARTKAWFLNYYKTSKFEDHFKLTKKGKPLQFIEDKTGNALTGKGGFYIMYPIDRSGLNMEQTFVLFTLTLQLNDTAYHAILTDMVCIGSKTSSQDMRPPEYGLEAYNERRLNDKDYVQDYVIPQVTNSVRKLFNELSVTIRNGLPGTH